MGIGRKKARNITTMKSPRAQVSAAKKANRNNIRGARRTTRVIDTFDKGSLLLNMLLGPVLGIAYTVTGPKAAGTHQWSPPTTLLLKQHGVEFGLGLLLVFIGLGFSRRMFIRHWSNAASHASDEYLWAFVTAATTAVGMVLMSLQVVRQPEAVVHGDYFVATILWALHLFRLHQVITTVVIGDIRAARKMERQAQRAAAMAADGV